MIISLLLFRSWGASHSCLVMFDNGGLTLRKILAIYVLRILSACSDRVQDKQFYLIISIFGTLLSVTAKLGFLAHCNRELLLNRFLTVLNKEDWKFLCRLPDKNKKFY